MKKIIYVCILFLLSSCKDKEPLIDRLCPCDFKRERKEYADLNQREIVLFFDSIPGITKLAFQESDIGYIVYDIKRDSAVCYTEQGSYHLLICNLPEDVKSWNVGINGISITCSGTAYQSCFIPAILSYACFDFIITSFQKK